MNKVKINIKINNKIIIKEVEPDMLLSDFLRYEMKLTGTHISCDTAQCGSCIILLNNKCVKSCSILLAQCNNREITTVEGLGNKDTLHEIQKKFKNNHSLQCGFCTPGILFSALELSQRNEIVNEDYIRKFLDGNFCRCTGYHNIIKAIKNYLNEKKLLNEKI